MISRRLFVASLGVLAAPESVVAAANKEPTVLLIGDSHAGYLEKPFKAEATKRDIVAAVIARPGSSLRQWLRKNWLEQGLRKYPYVREVIVCLGTNCTRVERPRIGRDVQEMVDRINDYPYTNTTQFADETPIWAGIAPAWILPPPMKMNTDYLTKAVLDTEVFCYAPAEPLPLDNGGIHLTHGGYKRWAELIAKIMWE